MIRTQIFFRLNYKKNFYCVSIKKWNKLIIVRLVINNWLQLSFIINSFWLTYENQARSIKCFYKEIFKNSIWKIHTLFYNKTDIICRNKLSVLYFLLINFIITNLSLFLSLSKKKNYRRKNFLFMYCSCIINKIINILESHFLCNLIKQEMKETYFLLNNVRSEPPVNKQSTVNFYVYASFFLNKLSTRALIK